MTARLLDRPVDPARLDALLARAVSDLSAASGTAMLTFGHRLGLFKAMRGAGPLTSQEVAERAGLAERYVREWLHAQVAGGYVDYDAASERFELSPEQAAVLADEDNPVFLPPALQVAESLWYDQAKTLEAFRTGRGVAWGEHHPCLHEGVAAFYKNGYRASLVPQWLPALDGVVARLEDGIDVADVGCGHGHSTALMAEAFPRSRFHGFDLHGPSLEAGRRHARDGGLGNVAFESASATSYPQNGYGLICFFDTLHDLGDPLAAARHARAALAPDGTLLVVEPFANDRLEDNVNPVGRLYYADSVAICCAHAISEGGTQVLGAQAGEARLTGVLRKAGFTRVRRAAATPFNLVLEARP